jgi:hypothetical protein
MIKKRIFILTLNIIFLISTTGLPITYHLCQMMQKKTLSACEMCNGEMEKMETSCCAEEVVDNSVIIKSEKSVCCQEEFVYNKVEDEFVNIKTDVNFFASSEILLQPIVLIPHTFDFFLEESFYCDSSPPFLINPEIHITNSILLI